MATGNPTDRGPWRILILDSSDPDDARWILTTVTVPAEVRPAVMEPGGRRYADWPAVTERVRERRGATRGWCPPRRWYGG